MHHVRDGGHLAVRLPSEAIYCIAHPILERRSATMAAATNAIEEFVLQDYKAGFVTDIEMETVPRGLNEDIVRLISAKKNEPEWLLEWRLKAYRHWLTMTEPHWHNVHYPKIDFQDIIYYAAPKEKKKLNSLDEVDPELLSTFEKLGISLDE